MTKRYERPRKTLDVPFHAANVRRVIVDYERYMDALRVAFRHGR